MGSWEWGVIVVMARRERMVLFGLQWSETTATTKLILFRDVAVL